jgi:hypothetical protein
MTKPQRRKIIVKRVAARKIRATWQLKRAQRGQTQEPADDPAGLPEADDELDEALGSLVG